MLEVLVSVVMGSDSDRPIMKRCVQTLEMFGVGYEVRVLSAHRMPEKTASFARRLEEKGVKVVIVGAGGAAHLAGVIAAHTTLPVVGVPLPSTSLQGVDALYSTVQMPSGIPVACMAIGGSGAFNAAIFAVHILSLYQDSLKKRLKDYREKMSSKEGSHEEDKDLSRRDSQRS